jgi:hypothetical protein
MAKILISFALLLSITVMSYAHSGGPNDGYAGDPPNYRNCTHCHSTFPVNSGDGVLEIQGLPAEYIPESTYVLTVFLADTGQMRWGFEMTVINSADSLQAGEMIPVNPSRVQISPGAGSQRDYAKQTSTGTDPGQPNGTTWSINWTAPLAGTGPVQFYLAGNAADNNNNKWDDYIYTIDVEVLEGQAGECGDANGIGGVTTADGYHVLNYFGAGPALDCAPCDF